MAGRGGPAPSSPLPIDSLGLWAATVGLPEQVVSAADPAPVDAVAGRSGIGGSPVSAVVVLGAGTARLAGELLAALSAPLSPVPFVVIEGAQPPAFVGPTTLVLAVSWSGETADTLAATARAAERGARVVAVTAGGRLGSAATSGGWPVLPVVGRAPCSRAALAAMVVPPLLLLERLGLVAGAKASVAEAAELLGRRRDAVAGGDGAALDIARRVGRTIPLVHGATGVSGVAARRWKAQVNENAKSPAFYSVHPSLEHDELAGWGQQGDVTRQLVTLVVLRHGGEAPGVARRMERVADILEEVTADVVEVRAEGATDLARFFDLAFVGDVVSLHLAAAEGLDPGPTPTADEVASLADERPGR